MNNMENQKFCQSCAMPLTKAENFGTEADGSASADYCVYCYKDGAFAADMTMEQMIGFCVPYMAKDGVTEDEARAKMMEFFPHLKRWTKK